VHNEEKSIAYERAYHTAEHRMADSSIDYSTPPQTGVAFDCPSNSPAAVASLDRRGGTHK
jgi:hypothetical protein